MKTRYMVYLRRHALAGATPAILAEATGCSRADAQNVLRAKAPRAVAVCDSKEEALELLEELRAHGLEGVAVTPQGLKRFDPRILERGSEQDVGILWSADRPEPFDVLLGPGDVRMIVVGKFLYRTETTSRTESTAGPLCLAGMGYGAGLAYMGYRHASLQPEQSRIVRRDEESFFCMFQPGGACYLIRETQFEYKATLPKVLPTREGSFRAVVSMARQAHPAAVFDDSLYRFPQAVRMFNVGMQSSAGGVVQTTTNTARGSTEERAMTTARLLYLQAFGAG